ncbi:DUF6398 domain-containing protein [Geodermatophilus marinus]|uniref:DUF6398 domain-containing protein n=1 Tax=Geodermatophilus sp. LHW52908 TaxID=2303986 RepID=UPI0011C1994A|nr:DUF6398 domain-containing protein [Geodermatophilus sp. LHW52908]
MPKRSRRPARGTGSRPRKARPPRRRRDGAPSRQEGPDLVDEIAGALAADHPLPLLGLVSSFLDAFGGDPSPLDPRPPGWPTLDDLLQSFVEAPLPETSAVLAGIAGLSGDEVLRSRVRREIAARGDVLPRWLAELHRSVPADRAVQVRHVLGDSEDLVVGIRFADGSDACAVVLVDHNMGGVAKDAFVVPGPLPEVVALLQEAAGDDPDTSLEDLDPADARARITEAVALGAHVYPPLESETWPGCRPFVEWVVRLLPAGGTGYVRPEWSEADTRALAERFLASPHGTGPDDADARLLLDRLLWFGTDYGPGDPMRWSPTAVEILLADWIPRKVVAEAEHLARVPQLLRAFIRFCHAERGIRPELTAETLAAVDEFEPGYQQAIRTPRPQGPDALLAAIGALDPADAARPPEDPLALPPASARARLGDLVGGGAALDRLDGAPLPDEPFRWDGVPEQARARVGAVLELVDRCCDELFDVELRTAARRVLARVAATDPAPLRRGRVEGAAAAVCWLVARANDAFTERRIAVRDLAGWFGVSESTPAARAKPLLQVLGIDPYDYTAGPPGLRSPDQLTSSTRRALIEIRDRLP